MHVHVQVPSEWYPTGVRKLRHVTKKHHQEWARKAAAITDGMVIQRADRFKEPYFSIVFDAYKPLNTLKRLTKMTKEHYHQKRVKIKVLGDWVFVA